MFEKLMEFSALCEVMGLDFSVDRKTNNLTALAGSLDVSTPHSNLRRYRSCKAAGDQW